MARQQSASGPPTVQMVSVAVLPPRLPTDMAPPTGVGAADVFSWDEAVNWEHNQPINAPTPSKGKSILRKTGLTTQRKRANPDLPPFQFRQVPYDVWRKHYAKDKDGRYHGTHAPAEDCLLLPEDVAKWRVGEPTTKADLWTRGSHALPVYSEVQSSAAPPTYEVDYTGPPPEERTLSVGDTASVSETQEAPEQTPQVERPRQTIADGKTAQEIIDQAKKKHEQQPKLSFKQQMKKGVEMVGLGSW